VLTSRRAPGLGDLVEAADRPGAAFEIVALLASHAGSDALAQARSAGIPARLHDAAAFCAERGSKVGDLSVRPEYDRATLPSGPISSSCAATSFWSRHRCWRRSPTAS